MNVSGTVHLVYIAMQRLKSEKCHFTFIRYVFQSFLDAGGKPLVNINVDCVLMFIVATNINVGFVLMFIEFYSFLCCQGVENLRSFLANQHLPMVLLLFCNSINYLEEL